MVGAKKLVSDLKDLKILFNNLGEVITDPRPVIYDLLKEYNVVEVHREGSPLHKKAGLSFDKVLVKAFNKRQGEKPNARQ